MKKLLSILKKKSIISIFTLAFSVSVFAQGQPPALICNDSFPQFPGAVRFNAQNYSSSNPTNAISVVESLVTQWYENISLPGEPATGYWITTRVYTCTIPFYATSLTGKLEFTTDTFCNYPTSYPNYGNQSNWWIIGTIKVNGSMAPSGTRNYPTGDLYVGEHNYVVESICSGGVGVYSSYSQTCNTQPIKVIVNRLPNPNFNLSAIRVCNKNNQNIFTGYMTLNMFGTYTGVDNKFFLSLTNSAGNQEVRLVDIGATTNPNGVDAFGNIPFGLNVVKLKYKYNNAVGTAISQNIATGNYGWTDQSFNRLFNSCLNIVKGETPKYSSRLSQGNDLDDVKNTTLLETKIKLYPNPIDDLLTVKVSEIEEIKSIKVFDIYNALIFEDKSKQTSALQQIDISNFQSGLYFIEVQTNQRIFKEKIVKK